MAKAAQKASATTTLVIGQVKVPIALFASADKPGGLATFDTAGPSGGRLMARPVARPTEQADESREDQPVVKGDPLGDDPGRDAPLEMEAPARPLMAAVDGRYGQELVEEGTGEVVPPENVRRGVRLEGGAFVDCTAQLADIEVKTRLDSAEIVGFVPVNLVPRARVKAVNYVGVIDQEGAKALRLIFEAMRAKRRVAVAKLTKKTRQTLGVFAAYRDTLMFYELVWAEDFRPAPARALAIQKASISPEELSMACDLVEAMSGSMALLDELRDDAIARREELHAKALAGDLDALEIVDAEVIEPADELLEQLAASLAVA